MKYIYESPDNGKTVYRYPLGFPDKKELVDPTEPQLVHMEVEGIVISYEE